MGARLPIHFSREVLGVRIIALLTAVMGVVNVLSAVRPSLHDRLRLLEQYSPLQVTHGGHLTSALAGFALLLLSSGLWRRKRVAWLLTLLVLVASIVAHLLKGLDYEEASLAALLLVVLLLSTIAFPCPFRSTFRATGDTNHGCSAGFHPGLRRYGLLPIGSPFPRQLRHSGRRSDRRS